MIRPKLKICLALAAALMASVASATSFTVAVIPDTQNYCDTAVTQEASAQVFARETAYLAAQKTAQNIVFTSHVGDVVQHGDLYTVEWTRASAAMNNLAAANMAFGMSPGNHDYDNYSHSTGSRPLAGSVAWNANFGPGSSYFAGKSWYGGSFNGGLDSYQTFSGGGYNFLHIALEMEASDAALTWAQGVLDAHPGMPTIVTTHEYISYQNGADGKAVRLDDGYMNGTPHNNAQQVWDKFLSQDSQIFMVLCGHNFNGAGYPANRRTDADAAGLSVYQLLSDYQATPSSATAGVGTGGGWVRLMEFNPDLNQIHVRTYSSELQKYSDDPTLTDGSSYARTWAPFNYAGGGSGALLASTDAASSDFTVSVNFNDRFNVPEPASLSFLGVAGLLALRRRRANRRP